jgi:putative alpha-1,2-mannosidase
MPFASRLALQSSTLIVRCLLALSPLQAQKPVASGQVGGHAKDVYPFLGVDWGGNTFIGAAVPFGMMKLGPDMETFDGRPSGFGYWTGGRILGFSHTHLSGAQGKYGNILVMPVTGPLVLGDVKSPRTAEINHHDYYSARLTRYNTLVELTSTRRVGVLRYTFPASPESHIALDVSHCLDKGIGSESQRFDGGELQVVSNHEVLGVGRYSGGWNKGGEYKVYFDMVLDTPASAIRTWTGSSFSADQHASADGSTDLGATFDLPTHAGQVVQAKVAISFISTAQAHATLLQKVRAGVLTLCARPPMRSGTVRSLLSTSRARPTPNEPRSIPRSITPC